MTSAWAIIPARGGSKSIPRKNLTLVAGVPLLDYSARAAIESNAFARIFCSTDDDAIAARARTLGIEVSPRPAIFASDDAKVDAAARDLLEREIGSSRPDVVALIQPTSPFLLPEHIHALMHKLAVDPKARSAHTVALCTHNCHAWNQRELVDGRVRFPFKDERAKARNKQEKPPLYIFGNLIMARTDAILDGSGFYAEPCAAFVIPRPYDFDLDVAEDISIAEALIRSRCVKLPHMKNHMAAAS